MHFTVAVEGISDEGLAGALLEYVGVETYTFTGRSGKSQLLKKLGSYNEAAKHIPWLVLVDLDADFPCAPEALEHWLEGIAISSHMCLRVAVTEMESWLLADPETLASFLAVSPSLIPGDPDTIEDPKGVIVNLARRSRRREIRDGLVPRPKSGRSIGPTYASDVSGFALDTWRPDVARTNSPSLDRCLRSLRALVEGLRV